MAVCIGVLCAGAAIFGASDQMITGGDIRFEVPNSESPPSKIFMLTNSVVAMTAGDVGERKRGSKPDEPKPALESAAA